MVLLPILPTPSLLPPTALMVSRKLLHLQTLLPHHISHRTFHRFFLLFSRRSSRRSSRRFFLPSPYFPPCFAGSCGSCSPSSSNGTGALIGCQMPGCQTGCRYYTTTTTCGCTGCTNACGVPGSVSSGCSTSNTGSVCV